MQSGHEGPAGGTAGPDDHAEEAVDVPGKIAAGVAEGVAEPTPAPASTAWSAFADGIEPFVEMAIAGGLAWLGCIVVARLIATIPVWTTFTVTRRMSTQAKAFGAVATLAAAAGYVAVAAMPGVFGEALIWGWVVLIVLAVLGAIVLAIGMATTPRLQVTVLQSSGEPNAAWATEVTVRMRELNMDDPKGRVERPNGSDLNDLVAIADRADNWAIALIGGALSMLLNLTPWRLEVTIFDTRSGIARLRRNGRFVEDAPLELPRDPADAEHPTELLILAAAFAATTVARAYPDIVGFYNTRNWLGLGLIGIARRSSGIARRDYISRAIQADPRNLLVEYEDVYERYGTATDEESLSELLDRLEPMIRVAAVLSGHGVEALGGVKARPWHELDLNGDHAESAPRRRRTAPRHEPTLLMLRLMAFYCMAIRNWMMYEYSEAAEDVRSVEWTTEGLERRERATGVVREFIVALQALPKSERKAAHAAIERMQQRAGLSLLLLLDDDGEDHRDDDGHDGSAHLRRDRGAGRAAAGRARRMRAADVDGSRRVALEWKAAAEQSTELEVRYSLACFISRQLVLTPGDPSPEKVDDIAKRLRSVCWVDEYRDLALSDPELTRLGGQAPLRRAVLPRMRDAWQIARFKEFRLPLESAGIRVPEELVHAAAVHRLEQRTAIDERTIGRLVDGARILDAALGIQDHPFDRAERLRVVRHLLDRGGHTVASLQTAYVEANDAVVADVAAAVHWIPDDEETAASAAFAERLVERLGALATT